MAQSFLDCVNIVPCFQQSSGEAVPEGMTVWQSFEHPLNNLNFTERHPQYRYNSRFYKIPLELF
ncbi:hypothetical protein [Marinobacter algicola]|uniref:hypothetical protein n=1 Tax=Marinobacter algicola TaxID=236100 RepID=UPI003BACC8F7